MAEITSPMIITALLLRFNWVQIDALCSTLEGRIISQEL
jgi:hypothetical protein